MDQDNTSLKHPYLALTGWLLLYLAVIPITLILASGFFPEPLRESHECVGIMSCLEWEEGFRISGIFFLAPVGTVTFIATMIFAVFRQKPWVPHVTAIKASLWVTILFILAAILLVSG